MTGYVSARIGASNSTLAVRWLGDSKRIQLHQDTTLEVELMGWPRNFAGNSRATLRIEIRNSFLSG